MKKKILAIMITAAFVCMSAASCTPRLAETASQSDAAETKDPAADDLVEFYANGEKIDLNDEQIGEVITIAEYAVNNSETTLNTIITTEKFEEAKKDGIALRVNYSDDSRKNLVVIVSPSQGAIASRGGGSAHMMASDLAGRLMEIGGLENENTDTATSLEVTENNGLMIAMMVEGQGASVKEEDIEPIYNLINKIKGSEDNKLNVILSKGYIEAVRLQGAYIELYKQEDGEHTTVYIPHDHEGVAVFNDTEAYEITDDIKNKLSEIAFGYRTAEIDFESDLLDENTGIDITYFTKDFRTDVQTKKDIQNVLVEITQNSEPINEVDMSLVYGYDDIDKYAYEKGVVVTVANEDAPFRAFFTQEQDGKKYDLVYLNYMYFEIDEEHLSRLSDIMGIAL